MLVVRDVIDDDRDDGGYVEIYTFFDSCPPPLHREVNEWNKIYPTTYSPPMCGHRGMM
jgi:hypothetical protein